MIIEEMAGLVLNGGPVGVKFGDDFKEDRKGAGKKLLDKPE